MPKLRTENISQGDQSWLGSTEGIAQARTEVLETSAFGSGSFPNGYVPSGYPLAKVNSLLVPYNSAATDGSEHLTGHLLFDTPVFGMPNYAVAVLDFGRVKTARVPQTGFAAPDAAHTVAQIVYI